MNRFTMPPLWCVVEGSLSPVVYRDRGYGVSLQILCIKAASGPRLYGRTMIVLPDLSASRPDREVPACPAGAHRFGQPGGPAHMYDLPIDLAPCRLARRHHPGQPPRGEHPPPYHGTQQPSRRNGVDEQPPPRAKPASREAILA